VRAMTPGPRNQRRGGGGGSYQSQVKKVRECAKCFCVVGNSMFPILDDNKSSLLT
jgi:hypothetical protein